MSVNAKQLSRVHEEPRTKQRAKSIPRPNDFRPDVQGLRAVAVLLVVLYHANMPLLTGGFVGVDVFFVISGFLITTHIVRGLQLSQFSFIEFYSRRIRRILPASLAVLVATLAIAWLVVPPLALARVSRDAIWTALYIPNLLFARDSISYFRVPEPSLFQHYWSLGIEEQFYLIGPLIIWASYLLSRRKLVVVQWVVTVLVVTSFVGSVWLTSINQPQAFFLLPTRAWELGIGALVAFMLLKGRLRIRKQIRYGIGLAGLAALIVSAFTFTTTTPFPSYYAALPVLATAAVLLAGPYDGLLGRMLQNRFALWVGAISYSLYLVHWPLLTIPVAAGSWMDPLELWQSLTLAAIALPLAWLCYRYVETPFRHPRATTRRTVWLPILAAVTLAALVSVVSFGAMRSVSSQEFKAEIEAPAFQLTTQPTAPPVVGSNLNVRLQDAQSESAIPSGLRCNLTVMDPAPPPGCTYGINPAAPSVALVGDSHAAQWAPAFEGVAASGRIYLTAHTKSGCPLQDRSLDADFTETPDCLRWKERVLEKLHTDQPSIIVISGSVKPTPETEADSNKERADRYETSMRALIPKLPKGSTVVLLRDTPSFPGDPISCLSANLYSPETCSVSRVQGLNPLITAVDAELAKEFGLVQLDFTDYLCADTCPVVQGDLLVFKDGHHISKTFSREMAPALQEALTTLEGSS